MSLDIFLKMWIQVCGYRWANKRLSTEHYMNGVCYWSNHQVSENEDFVKVLPIVTQGKVECQRFSRNK